MSNLNFDLIQKLIRLANNNPNEHEANAAARRACKMLEDHRFIMNSSKPKVEIRQPKPWSGAKQQYSSQWHTTNFDDLFSNFGNRPAGKVYDRPQQEYHYRQCVKCGGFYDTPTPMNQTYICTICTQIKQP